MTLGYLACIFGDRKEVDMAELRYRTERSLEARVLFAKMAEVYEADEDDSLFAVFGEGAENGTVRSSDTEPPVGRRVRVSEETIRLRKVDLGDILHDLATRGELDPGRYNVRLSW